MKFDAWMKGAVAGAIALSLAACGGGGGGGSASASASLQVSGTAASGAALAHAAVEVKCAAGSGTATTAADGRYSVSMAGAALPCVVQVTGQAGAATLVLHSVTEAGTTDGSGNTDATANVTPITELVVARLAAKLPKDFFAGFGADAAKALTADDLKAAAAAVIAALKNAGIALADIDPLKSQLVAANGTTSGNDYDQLLDQFGGKVPPAALEQLMNLVANAGRDTGLDDALAAVSGGTLKGCPAALSGKYRTLDYRGRSVVRSIDFGADTFSGSDGSLMFITQDAANPCAFAVDGMGEDGQQAHFDVVMGPAGVGAYRKQTFGTPATNTVGTLFPVQPLPASALAGGTWSFLESGFIPGAGELHFPGQIRFDAAGLKATTCAYDTSSLTAWPTCQADPQNPDLTLTARDDGGFDLMAGTMPEGQLWGYRAANGALTLFGTTDASGSTDASVVHASLVGSQLQALAVPAVGTQTRSTSMQFYLANGVDTTPDPLVDSYKVTAADAAAGTLTRQRADGRVEQLKLNAPVTGVRYREAGANFAAIDQVPLTGLGVTVSVNAQPSTPNAHLLVISVVQ